jgi:hypothetical protein
VKTTRRQFVFCVLGAPLLARGVEDVQHPLAEHAVLEEFDRRVKAYVALHDRLEATLPPFAPSNDMAVIERHAAAMARLLHASRGDARRGDLFAPDAEAVIRTRVAMALEGVDTYALLADLEEEHPGAVSLKPRVNASYPHRECGPHASRGARNPVGSMPDVGARRLLQCRKSGNLAGPMRPTWPKAVQGLKLRALTAFASHGLPLAAASGIESSDRGQSSAPQQESDHGRQPFSTRGSIGSGT